MADPKEDEREPPAPVSSSRAYRLPAASWTGNEEPTEARRPKARMLAALAQLSAAHGEDGHSETLSRRASSAHIDERARTIERSRALRRSGNHALESGDFVAAERFLRRALDIRQDVGEPDMDDLAALATILRLLHRWPEAEALFQRATRMGDGPLMDDAPPLVAHELSNLLRCLGRVRAATAMVDRALAASTRRTPEVPELEVALLHHVAAECAIDGGDTQRADEHVRAAMSIRSRWMGVDTPLFGATLATSARVQHREGHLGNAERTLLLAYESVIADSELNPYAPHLLVAMGDLWCDLDRASDAEVLVRGAIATISQANGPDHPFVRSALRVHVRTLRALTRQAEAEAAERRMEQIAASWSPPS